MKSELGLNLEDHIGLHLNSKIHSKGWIELKTHPIGEKEGFET